MQELFPPALRIYGQLKFLTYQCLLIQVLNALLHVAACFSRAFVGPRDFVFSTLAYPVGSIVVYTFWSVWHLMGRELIFPEVLSQYYPNWLNHTTHTVIAPLNILLAITVNHKYSKGAVSLTLIYFASYVGLLNYIKAKTGHAVYKYLDTMSDVELVIYYLGTGLSAYLMYKTGQYLTNFVHFNASNELEKQKQAKASKKTQKQKS